MLGQIFIAHSKEIPTTVREAFRKDYIASDKLMLIVILIQWLIAAGVSSNLYGYYLLGIVGGGISSLVALIAYFLFRGQLLGRCLMATSMVMIFSVFVQQMNGLGEGHFQYFIMVAVLTRYRDKVPLLVHTVLTIVHHVSLTYCQVQGIKAFGVDVTIFTWGAIVPLALHLFVATISVIFALYMIHISTSQFLESANVVGIVHEASRGNLDGRISGAFAKSGISSELNDFMVQISDIINKMDSGSSQLAAMSEELSASTVEMDKATEEITFQTEQEVASVTETKNVTDHMIEISGKTRALLGKVREVVMGMDSNASKGTQSMKDANNSMRKIESSSHKIGGIVTVITEIANQTNLLSLNAAIEAAKAGDSGKGFAVVAEEVRSLAERSSKSVTEIQQLIGISNENVKDGVRIIQTTGDVFQQLIEQVQSTSEQLVTLEQSYNEQIDEVSRVSERVNTVLDASQDISSSTNELSATTKQISKTALELARMAEDNKRDISFFHKQR